MTEYRGNALAEVEVALRLNKNGVTLTRPMMEQLLGENAALVEKANELVRENDALRRQIEGHCERIARQSELLSRRAEKEAAPVSQGGGCTMLTENAGG